MGRTDKSAGIRWQFWTNIGIACVLLVLIIIAGRKVRHYVATDAQFTLATPDESTPGLSMQGLVYTSRSRVLDTFEADFGRSIFLVPLPERRRRLLAVDWVEDAGIARVWPNRIDVRITERRPVAFVNLPVSGGLSSRVLLIDSQGVLLEPPAQSHFKFPVLGGITDDQGELDRRQRVRAMLRLLDDLGPTGKDISEVNAANPENLIVIAQMDGRAVELVMGNRHFSRRLQNFMEHYPEIRRRTGNLRAFDLRLDDRITAGGQER